MRLIIRLAINVFALFVVEYLVPGTSIDVPHRSRTLIRNAAIPKVKIEIGRATSCRIGLINVLTTPITTAATTAVQRPAK